MYPQKIELHLTEENLKEEKLKKREMKEEKSDEVLKPPCQTRSLASRPRADLGQTRPIWAYLGLLGPTSAYLALSMCLRQSPHVALRAMFQK